MLHRFDWFVDNFLSELSAPEFKHIESDIESQVQLQAQQKLKEFKKQDFSGIRIADTVVVSGTCHKRILEYVKSAAIDLIIMGAGSPLQKVMLGSVVEKVSRLSTIPVMLDKCV